MARADWSWGGSYTSPTLTVMPQHPIHFDVMETTTSSNPSQTAYSNPQWTPQTRPVPPHNARKRSRDDMGWDDDDESSPSSTAPFPSSQPTPSPPKRQSVIGPGMTLTYLDAPVADTSSQPGTWAEELSERLKSSDLERDEATSRPGLESRKSIRLDKSDIEGSAPTSYPPHVGRASREDPTIDEATRTLGMSWTSIASTPTMDAASRGWARYIENHFPLQSAKIVWKNSSLPAFLVSAVTCDGRQRGGSPAIPPGSRAVSPWHRPVGSPGYFLFDEQMTQGRMIAKSWGQTLDNLRAFPVVFEGAEVMEADEDEMQRSVEGSNFQHWAGWKSTFDDSSSSSLAFPSVETPGDGMELD